MRGTRSALSVHSCLRFRRSLPRCIGSLRAAVGSSRRSNRAIAACLSRGAHAPAARAMECGPWSEHARSIRPPPMRQRGTGAESRLSGNWSEHTQVGRGGSAYGVVGPEGRADEPEDHGGVGAPLAEVFSLSQDAEYEARDCAASRRQNARTDSVGRRIVARWPGRRACPAESVPTMLTRRAWAAKAGSG